MWLYVYVLQALNVRGLVCSTYNGTKLLETMISVHIIIHLNTRCNQSLLMDYSYFPSLLVSRCSNEWTFVVISQRCKCRRRNLFENQQMMCEKLTHFYTSSNSKVVSSFDRSFGINQKHVITPLAYKYACAFLSIRQVTYSLLDLARSEVRRKFTSLIRVLIIVNITCVHSCIACFRWLQSPCVGGRSKIVLYLSGIAESTETASAIVHASV